MRSIFGWDLPPGCSTRALEDAMGYADPLDITQNLRAGGVTGWRGWWDEDDNLMACRDEPEAEPRTLATCEWSDDLDDHGNMARAAHALATAIRSLA